MCHNQWCFATQNARRDCILRPSQHKVHKVPERRNSANFKATDRARKEGRGQQPSFQLTIAHLAHANCTNLSSCCPNLSAEALHRLRSRLRARRDTPAIATLE